MPVCWHCCVYTVPAALPSPRQVEVDYSNGANNWRPMATKLPTLQEVLGNPFLSPSICRIFSIYRRQRFRACPPGNRSNLPKAHLYLGIFMARQRGTHAGPKTISSFIATSIHRFDGIYNKRLQVSILIDDVLGHHSAETILATMWDQSFIRDSVVWRNITTRVPRMTFSTLCHSHVRPVAFPKLNVESFWKDGRDNCMHAACIGARMHYGWTSYPRNK